MATPRNRYTAIKDGEWVQPVRKGYKLACCDCALSHLMEFRLYRGEIQFRAWRDNRATANKRRGYRGIRFSGNAGKPKKHHPESSKRGKVSVFRKRDLR